VFKWFSELYMVNMFIARKPSRAAENGDIMMILMLTLTGSGASKCVIKLKLSDSEKVL